MLDTIHSNKKPEGNVKKKFKLAILASHPIQYQTPFFRELAKQSEIDLEVFFCSDFGFKTYKDEGFGKELKWDIPLLDGYKYEFLENISMSPTPSSFWGLINPHIVQKIRSGSYDAIWIHGWAHCTNWLAMITAFTVGVPVLLRGESNLLNDITQWKKLVKGIILRWLFKRIKVFLAIGKYNSEFYEYYGTPKEKIFLVPYVVDNHFFISKANELLSQKNTLRIKYKIPEDQLVILFCGKLISIKRPMDLLKAFEIVSSAIKSSLVFVGDGVLHKDLETYIKENKIQNVFFMGFRNQTELSEFYTISDVLVLPSEHEPWGLVVNEAMCFGLPIIVSDKVGAGGDLVKEGVNGYVFQEGKVLSLVEKLKELLLDKKKRIEFSKSSRQIIERWSFRECRDKLVDGLKALVPQ